jgi:SAM-dependent methyltransferase
LLYYIHTVQPEPPLSIDINQSINQPIMPTATESSLRDPIMDWTAFSPEQIPTKGIKLPNLFHDTLRALEQGSTQPQSSLQILELGCGCGELCAFLRSRQHQHKVIGTDINHGAIASANEKCLPGAGTCFVADVTAPNLAEDIQSKQRLVCHSSSGEMNSPPLTKNITQHFDFVILQLLLSIVGGPASRKATMLNAASLLRPGGTLYLSCSGVSHDINANYAQLYQTDRHDATMEPYSYFSRNEQGEILYTTHHFTEPELRELLQEAGLLVEIHIEQHKETSSRRPNEAAYFFYATAKRHIA